MGQGEKKTETLDGHYHGPQPMVHAEEYEEGNGLPCVELKQEERKTKKNPEPQDESTH